VWWSSPLSTRGANLVRKDQPYRPMTGRCSTAYGRRTITNQPTTDSKEQSRKVASLTPTEMRVLALLPTYRTLASIGIQLGIGRPTVKTHVENIYKKLGATKRADAVKLAESAGLLPRH